MATINTVCEICQGLGLIEQNDTTATCSNCNGKGRVEQQTPDTIYPRLQGKIDAAIANGEAYIRVDREDAQLMTNAGYVQDTKTSQTMHELGHPGYAMLLAKLEPATKTPTSAVTEQASAKIPASIKVAFEDDNNGYGSACEWMLTDGNTEFDEDEFERFARETYDHWTYQNDSDLSFEDFKRRSDYTDCKDAVMGCCEDATEEAEGETALESVMTASEVAEEFDLAEATVRQYLNRNNPWWARKSAGTWLVLRANAKTQWGK
jgi:hypothetical protein